LSTRLPRSAGTALGATRVALGAAMLARPVLIPRLLGADRVTAERMTWLVRMLGGREIALGLGAASRRVAPDPRPWVLAGAISDATDALALAAAVRRGRVNRVLGSGALLTSAGAAGLAAYAIAAAARECRLEPQPPGSGQGE
jgi:hypothetical protein